MQKLVKKILLIILPSIISFSCISYATKCKTEQIIKHQIQLQLFDSLGFPVPNTEFWVDLDIVKNGPKVTIQLPLINFQTGQSAKTTGESKAPIPGGYLYTTAGFLPQEICPRDLVPRSIIAASNNGMTPIFTNTKPIDSIPAPIGGYILQVTNAGEIIVQAPGTVGNIIPPGTQVLLPTEITYIVKPQKTLCKNFKISRGVTNTTKFTGFQANISLRDSHVNDAFDNVAAWAWVENSTVPDKTNGVLNVMVAVGKIDKNGIVKVGKPIQLTNLKPPLSIFDTSVAINRTNKKNIIVSYGLANYDVPTSPFFGAAAFSYRAVSFDGGKTWPAEFNGPTNIQPTGPAGLGDLRGVASDKFGNIWLCSTNHFDNAGNDINQPFFAISTDGGVTFIRVYTVKAPPVTSTWDFPQFCFGGDQNGNYGLYFQTNLLNNITGDTFPAAGFIPINGLGVDKIDSKNTTFAELRAFTNSVTEGSITASLDGRLWFQGDIGPASAGGPPLPWTYILPQVVTYKSPGPISKNYVGPWNYIVTNDIANQFFGVGTQGSGVISQPVSGYFTSPQSAIYDNKRQALYLINAALTPFFSQNMNLFFIISRDNGQTWSTPLNISTTSFANRGFQSMALDTKTGNLVFGWYDGRNDPTFKSIEYFGAVIPSKVLDKLVNNIPLSNPTFKTPPSTKPPVTTELTERQIVLQKELIRKKQERFLKKLNGN